MTSTHSKYCFYFHQSGDCIAHMVTSIYYEMFSNCSLVVTNFYDVMNENRSFTQTQFEWKHVNVGPAETYGYFTCLCYTLIWSQLTDYQTIFDQMWRQINFWNNMTLPVYRTCCVDHIFYLLSLKQTLNNRLVSQFSQFSGC